MYFPYLRGRQFELIALRELVEQSLLSNKVIPIIEPVKLSSTLITTLKSFSDKTREIAVIRNPQVGDFRAALAKEQNKSLKEKYEKILESTMVIPTHILNTQSEKELKDLLEDGVKSEHLVTVCQNKDYIKTYENVFTAQKPKYNLILDESGFKRRIQDNIVLLADRFKKKNRNSDYANVVDEPFSEDHLYFEGEKYSGFSDYSVVGDEYVEAGFAPYAVAIHIVYFDDEKSLRIKHFVSDTNDDISDPAQKFAQAVKKLVNWNREQKVDTMGLNAFESMYEKEVYPGLGTVKKLSIMHHIELMSRFLDGASSS